MVTLDNIKHSDEINELIRMADNALAASDFTLHNQTHVNRVVDNISFVTAHSFVEFSEREKELAQIAAYMHDIGNVVNRMDHSHSGAVLAYCLLKDMAMPQHEILEIMTAIGNHDIDTGVPVNKIGAALIIADKVDVINTRVRSDIKLENDYTHHNTINTNVTEYYLEYDFGKFIANFTVNSGYTGLFFKLYYDNMMLCKKAADFLGNYFMVRINNSWMM